MIQAQEECVVPSGDVVSLHYSWLHVMTSVHVTSCCSTVITVIHSFIHVFQIALMTFLQHTLLSFPPFLPPPPYPVVALQHISIFNKYDPVPQTGGADLTFVSFKWCNIPLRECN